MGEMDARDEMLEMGPQSDPIREYLRRLIAEFGGYHYETCPANYHETSGRYGPCDCFAGALLKDARTALKAGNGA